MRIGLRRVMRKDVTVGFTETNYHSQGTHQIENASISCPIKAFDLRENEVSTLENIRVSATAVQHLEAVSA